MWIDDDLMTFGKFQIGTGLPAEFAFWRGYFGGIADGSLEGTYWRRQVSSGGRCQWVLDATFQVVEWPGQPLRFESVVLRTAARLKNLAV